MQCPDRGTPRRTGYGRTRLKTRRADADEAREPASAVRRTKGSSMDSEQFERLDVDQAATLLLWRFKKLTEAGHDTVRSLMMAVRPDVDIRLASDLLSVATEKR
jgi:hypothetical protein